MNTEQVYASQSGHWYRTDGTPCHEVPCKSRPGEMRPATLKDARKLGLYPSVSGILKIMDQPGLRRWRDNQLMLAAFGCCGYGCSESPEEFAERALKVATENMDVCRDRGTEVHTAILKYFEDYKNCLENPEQTYLPRMRGCSDHIQSAITSLVKLGVNGEEFFPERSFSSPLGYGGCTDYKTDSIIIDWKAVTKLEKKLDYWDRCAQIAAYNMGIFGELRRGANVFIDAETAECAIREWTREELEHGWETFKACFHLYKVFNRFDPLNIRKEPVSEEV